MSLDDEARAERRARDAATHRAARQRRREEREAAGIAPTPPGPKPIPPAIRFWKHVQKGEPTECWLWQAGVVGPPPNDYGRFGKVDGRMVVAHRYAWELAHGPITDDRKVLHTCDNPRCCNPGHLYLGTQKDNARDRSARGRHGSVTHPERWGYPHKISAADAAFVRANSKTMTRKELAERFKVSTATISGIIRWKIHRRVGEESPY